MLAACASAMVAKYGPAEGGNDASVDRLGVLEEKLDALCAAVEQLQATVSAKPVANGKGKTKTTAAA
jgi:hypothetical protein